MVVKYGKGYAMEETLYCTVLYCNALYPPCIPMRVTICHSCSSENLPSGSRQNLREPLSSAVSW